MRKGEQVNYVNEYIINESQKPIHLRTILNF